MCLNQGYTAATLGLSASGPKGDMAYSSGYAVLHRLTVLRIVWLGVVIVMLEWRLLLMPARQYYGGVMVASRDLCLRLEK